MNRLKRESRLATGMNLLIPLPKGQGFPPDDIVKKKSNGTDQNFKPLEKTYTIYTIKKGDTLWSIANEMGVNIGTLSRWNHLPPNKKLMPGDKLKIRMVEIPDLINEAPSLTSPFRKLNPQISSVKPTEFSLQTN
jgi:LysM repeat protein